MWTGSSDPKTSAKSSARKFSDLRQRLQRMVTTCLSRAASLHVRNGFPGWARTGGCGTGILCSFRPEDTGEHYKNKLDRKRPARHLDSQRVDLTMRAG